MFASLVVIGTYITAHLSQSVMIWVLLAVLPLVLPSGNPSGRVVFSQSWNQAGLCQPQQLKV